jgi:hypothetical protein
MQNLATAQPNLMVPFVSPENYLGDAENLRTIASDPNRTHLDRGVACHIVQRHVVLGTLEQEAVYKHTMLQLADLIEMGPK